MCAKPAHSKSTSHRRITCTVPRLVTMQPATNAFVVIQSNQLGAFSRFHYACCLPGQHQSPASNHSGMLLGCTHCERGAFSATNDTLACTRCGQGRFGGRRGLTVCSVCAAGRSSATAGASACDDCAWGKYTDGKTGAKSCSSCSAMYFGSAHCDVPVTAIVMVFLIALALALAARYIRKRYRKMKELQRRLQRELAKSKILLKAKTTDLALMGKAWKLQPSEVGFDKKLAAGAFGEVWMGSLHEKWSVAIKKMFVQEGEQAKSFLNDPEIHFLMRTRHPRLVMFLGCGTLNDGTVFMVCEFMEGGAMDGYLWDKPPVPWTHKLQVLLDVADGICYLHLLHKALHCDLKGPNVLLRKPAKDENPHGLVRAKVADFGLSKIVQGGKHNMKHKKEKDAKGAKKDRRAAMRRPTRAALKAASWNKRMDGFVGTPGWMAPELMQKKAKFGPAVDIYAYGMVMYECLAQAAPWSQEGMADTNTATLFKTVKAGTRPHVPSHIAPAPGGFKDLMEQCWRQDQARRPLIDQVRNTVQQIFDQCCAAGVATCGPASGTGGVGVGQEQMNPMVDLETGGEIEMAAV